MVPETVAVATHDCAYSGERMRTELGWTPRPLDRGMADMSRAILREAVTSRRRA
jgi:hypothetical protein